MIPPAVRRFRADDAPALAALFHAAVHALAARDYTPEQLAAWSPAPGDSAQWLTRAADGRDTLVAVDGSDQPIAYADVEADGHLDHLYCHPDHAGRGVAAALCEAVEATARARGARRISVEASEPARRFLQRRSYSVERRREVVLRGVRLHNYAMSKPLFPA